MLAQANDLDYSMLFATPDIKLSPSSPTEDDGICPSTAPSSRLGSPSPEPLAESPCRHRGKHPNGHKCGKSREDFNTDDEFKRYLRRRANNNDSATRSRYRKRAIQEEEAGRMQRIEEENKRLKATVAIYYDIVMKLTGKRRVSDELADVHVQAEQMLEEDLAVNTLKNVGEMPQLALEPIPTPPAMVEDLFSWDKQGLLTEFY